MARLLKRSGVSYTLVPAIVFACAILHSIVRERSDVGRTGVNGSRCSRSAPRGAESQLSRDQICIAARSARNCARRLGRGDMINWEAIEGYMGYEVSLKLRSCCDHCYHHNCGEPGHWDSN